MDTTLRRSVWSWFSVALIALLVLGFTAACGSDSDDDADAAATEVTDTATDMATAAGEGTDAVATEVEGAAEDVATATGGQVDTEQAGAIATCFEANTTGDMINDLRAGETGSAEEVYRGCLEESLPDALVAQMDPIIEQAASCGETASQDLTDADVTAIEAGDEALIQALTEETLACVESELGFPLS